MIVTDKRHTTRVQSLSIPRGSRQCGKKTDSRERQIYRFGVKSLSVLPVALDFPVPTALVRGAGACIFAGGLS